MNREHQKPADEGGNLYQFPFAPQGPHLVRAQVSRAARQGQVLQGPWPKRSASQLPAVEGSTQPLVREGPKEFREVLTHFPRFVDRILTVSLGRDAQYGALMARVVQHTLFDPVMHIDDEAAKHGAVADVFDAPYGELLARCDAAGQLKRAVIVEWLERWDSEDCARGAVVTTICIDRYQFVIDMTALLRDHAQRARIPVGSDAYRAISSIVPLFFILCVTPDCPAGMDADWFTLICRYTDRFPKHRWGRSTLI